MNSKNIIWIVNASLMVIIYIFPLGNPSERFLWSGTWAFGNPSERFLWSGIWTFFLASINFF